MTFQTQAGINKVSTLVDGSVRLYVDTPELPAEDMTRLFSLRNKQIWVAFKETELVDNDLDVKPTNGTIKGRSPSQRLRSVIYVLWEQQTDRSQSFEEFYKTQMEKIIEHLKSKLE